MMLRTILILIALSLATAANAQHDAELWASCHGKFGLCGYIERRARIEMIAPRFEQAMPFSEGLAAVRLDGLVGYIDRSGTVVIAPQFDLAGEFYQGLAEIVVGDKAGIVNRRGEIVVPPMFARAIPFTRDVVLASEGSLPAGFLAGTRGSYGALPGLQGHVAGPAGLYHVSGRWIRRPDLTRVRTFEREGLGILWAATGDSSSMYGLLSADGRWLAEPQYDHGWSLQDGLAIATKRIGDGRVSGALDRHGNVVIPFRGWSLFSGLNGWLQAQEGGPKGPRGLLDRTGNLLGGRMFEQIDITEPGGVAAVLADGKWIGLTRDGRLVPYPRDGRVSAACPFGVRIVETDGKWLITDRDGNPTTPYLFERNSGTIACDKPFPVKLGTKWSFIGLDGRLLVDPPIFEPPPHFVDGFIFVRTEPAGKRSILDTSGRVVVEARYDEVLTSRAGLFQVKADGREFWITPSGEERPEPPERYVPNSDMLACHPGMRLIEREGLWGLVENDGTQVIAPNYRALSCSANGVAFVPVDTQRQWCPIGPDGRMRDRPACRAAVHYFVEPSHGVPEKLHDDPYESSVLWSRAYLEFHSGKRDIPPGWTGLYGGPRDKVWR